MISIITHTCEVVSSNGPSQQCTISPGSVSVCGDRNRKSKGKGKGKSSKPTSLTFKYTGGGCSASDKDQGSKASCSGTINSNEEISISSGKGKGKGKSGGGDDYLVSPGIVQPGEEFTISADKFEADSVISISNSGGTEENEIHLSCSQLLNLGDAFGSLTLVAADGERADTDATLTYVVSNHGAHFTTLTAFIFVTISWVPLQGHFH